MKFRNVGIHSKLSSIMLTYSVVEKQSTRLNSKLPGAVFLLRELYFPFVLHPWLINAATSRKI